MNKSSKIIILLSVIALSGILINDVQQTNNTPSNSETKTEKGLNDSYTIKPVKIPEDLEFAGEKVPLGKIDIKNG